MSHQGSAHASYRTTEPTPIRPLRARSSSAGLTLENMAGLAMSSPSVETQNFPFPSASVTAASPLTTSTQVAIEIERPSVWKYYWKSSNAEESSGIMSRINGKSTYHGIDKSDKEPAAGGPVTVLSQPKESSKKEKKEKEKEQKAKDRLSKVKDTRRMDTLFGDRPLSTDHGDVYQTLASPTANLSSSSLSSDILTFPTVSSTPQTTTVPAPASKNFSPFSIALCGPNVLLLAPQVA
ncbi:hypothetical protein BC829DRAFT_298094 [Chytridium lagenaria]|nr:hypothetical protein BC829DRAFT_298094 [Chytridium lagenaria]